MIKFNPALLVAGGLGAVGISYFAIKGDDKGADAATKDVAPGGATPTPTPTPGTPGAATPPTGALPTPSPSPQASPVAPGTVGTPAGTAGATGQLQGEQVGPYTVVNDGGTQIVFETATQQPVGVLDAQGNLHEVTVDAQGNATVAPEASTNAGTAASAGTPGLPAPTGVGTTTDTLATQGALQGRQVGPYTVVDQGGTQMVFETATQQPIGVLDARGNVQGLPTSSASLSTPGTSTSSVAGTDAGQATGGGTYASLAASLFEAPVATGTAVGAADALAGRSQLGSGATQLGTGAPALSAEPARFA